MSSSFHKPLVSVFFGIICWGQASLPAFAATQETPLTVMQENLAKLEASFDGKIGVFAINTANNDQLQYRAQERFPMGCTSKLIGVSAILKKSMTDKNLLDEKIHYNTTDLVSWSPITKEKVHEGMTVSELCAAAIIASDNSAMNFLVKKMGGLQAMNAFARSIGDDDFRVDNDWPEEAKSGGPDNVYDSTTPAAMAKSLQKLTFGEVLAAPQREQLIAWFKSNTTGNARIRAGVPTGRVVGDKTGTGSYYGTTNDIGIIWPPHCEPIVVAVYFTQNEKNAKPNEAVVASVTRILLHTFAQNDTCIKQNLPSINR